MIIILLIIIIGLIIICSFKEKQLRDYQVKSMSYEKNMMKFKEYYDLLDQWMMNREQGMCIENYFLKSNYRNIAIYGMGPMGNHLYNELSKSDKVHVIYAIDKKGSTIFPELSIKKPTEELPEVDAVVITVTVSYGEIVPMLEEKICCSMVSLEEVICES